MASRLDRLGARALPLIALLSSCVPGGPSVPADAPVDRAAPPGVHPPGPPTPRELEPDVVSALTPAADGRPIVISTGAPGPAGYDLQLVYDDAADDPIWRWAQCLGRVTACYHANPGEPILGCLGVVERCATAEGGFGCCPTACIDDVEAAVAGGMSEDDAIDSVLLAGDCVDGFAAARDAALDEVSP